ncbi:MAG: FAD-dependent oxidoreductase [Elusimicrobiota bacterium]
MKKFTCDVLVIGGGVTGVTAAVAAARNGADTLLVERYGTLGGLATMGMVSPMYGFWSGDTQVVKGIAEEVINELRKYHGGTLGYQLLVDNCPGENKCTDDYKCPASGVKRVAVVDTEILKLVLPKMLEEAGVRVMLYTQVVNTSVKTRRVVSVAIESYGRAIITPRVVIDATGDGLIAGKLSPEKTGIIKQIQKPPTLMFRIGNVKIKKNRVFYKGGDGIGRLLLLRWPNSGEYIVNSPSGINKFDGTDAASLTHAQITAAKLVAPRVEYLRKNVPGCEDIKLLGVAAQIGIRDCLRVKGDYTLTLDDVISDRKFKDGIAAGCHPVDLHMPSDKLGGKNIIRRRCGGFYHIPYRSLVPSKTDNLLMAGRCISATFEAQGSTRVQATCMATGQAAGTAAALCIKDKYCDLRKVNMTELRNKLLKQNVVL